MKSPFRNWIDVARLVEPINEPNRPGWQTTKEGELSKTKDFKLVPIDVAEEVSPSALRKKSFKSAFKTSRGF